MTGIQNMQEQIAIQTERIGRAEDVLQELRHLLSLPKFQGMENAWIATGDVQVWIAKLQDALQSEDVIRLGSTVVSYDGPGRFSGVKGKVVGFKHHEGCLRYRIAVASKVLGQGEYPERQDDLVVVPPVNGVQKLFGGRCDGVVLAS